MRKTLKILSILNCICCCYCLTMFINPIVLENTDMGGFYVIVFGIILSTLMALLWTIFAFRKQKNNNKYCLNFICCKDKEYADLVRWVLTSRQKSAKNITGYTIFPTTDCNARCFYCFELDRSRIPMSVETARKVVRYIKDHCGREADPGKAKEKSSSPASS